MCQQFPRTRYVHSPVLEATSSLCLPTFAAEPVYSIWSWAQRAGLLVWTAWISSRSAQALRNFFALLILGRCTGSFPHPLLLFAHAHWRLTRLLPAAYVLLHVLRANTAALLGAQNFVVLSCLIITSLAISCNFWTRYSLVLPCLLVPAPRPLLRCWGRMPKLPKAVIRSILAIILKLQF